MGRLRLFGELIEAGGAAEGQGSTGGGGHQITRVTRTAGDYQTTSVSFVDIDTNNPVINVTTGVDSVSIPATAEVSPRLTVSGRRYPHRGAAHSVPELVYRAVNFSG